MVRVHDHAPYAPSLGIFLSITGCNATVIVA